MSTSLFVGYKFSVEDFIKSDGAMDYINALLKELLTELRSELGSKLESLQENETCDTAISEKINNIGSSIKNFEEIKKLIESKNYEKAANEFKLRNNSIIPIDYYHYNYDNYYVFMIYGFIYVCDNNILENPQDTLGVSDITSEYGDNYDNDYQLWDNHPIKKMQKYADKWGCPDNNLCVYYINILKLVNTFNSNK